MGIIAVDLFITLDGVYQAPGAPDEDREGGFEFGGWQGAYFDDESGESIGAGIDRLQALLLGRKTYDIFAGFWPNQGDDDPIADEVQRGAEVRRVAHADRALLGGNDGGDGCRDRGGCAPRPVRRGPHLRQRRPREDPAQGAPRRPAEPLGLPDHLRHRQAALDRRPRAVGLHARRAAQGLPEGCDLARLRARRRARHRHRHLRRRGRAPRAARRGTVQAGAWRAVAATTLLAEQRPKRLDRVGVFGALVVAIPLDAGEAQRDAAGVAT